MNSLYFALVMLFVFMSIGRKIGWRLSMAFLYGVNVSIVRAVVISFIWAWIVLWLDILLINAFHPNAIIKWIFGYALGMYVAIPNYGLIDESTIPFQYERDKHQVISSLPAIAFIIPALVYELFF